MFLARDGVFRGFCDEGATICDEFLSVFFQYCGGCVEVRCQYMVSILEHLGRSFGVYVKEGGGWVGGMDVFLRTFVIE